MLSNIGISCNPVLIQDGAQQQQQQSSESLKVDCRGHPIVPQQFNENNQDFDNFVVVGIWLALKEAGETLESIINWLSFQQYHSPQSMAAFKADQESKQQVIIGVINIEQIIKLAYSLKEQLFNLKHRGALSKAAQSFQKLCTKLIRSSNPRLSKVPQRLLMQSLQEIKTMGLSKILRRSAGIPPLILSILKAETSNSSSANNPKLLIYTLNFLYNQYESYKNDDQNSDDFKVHTLNIIKVIFQDSSLRHDVSQFVTRGLKLDIIGFSHHNWLIRNSSLMSFTAISRRVLGQNRIQQASIIMQMKDQAKKERGMTSNQFFAKFPDMPQFIRDVLDGKPVDNGIILGQGSKYLVLLLLSRLHPSLQSKQENQDIVSLIERQFNCQDIFTRQIAAKAILPFISRDQSLKFAIRCFKVVQQKIQNSQTIKISSNEVYGYLHEIYLLLIWGAGSKNSQNKIENFKIILQQIMIVIKSYIQGQLNSPILQISVKILTNVRKCILKLGSNIIVGQLEQELRKVICIQQGGKRFDPCFISLAKEIILYFQDFNPDVVVNFYLEKITNQEQQFITLIKQKHEEFQYIVERVIKIIKRKIIKGQLELESIALKTFNHTKSILQLNIVPLLDALLKLLETILKMNPRMDIIKLSQDNIHHIQRLINQSNPLLIRRVIKLTSVIAANSEQNFNILHHLLLTNLQKYSYSTSQDFVRVACVKAIRNINNLLNKQQSIESESLYKSFFFLLNDQNPALRKLVAYYISSFISKEVAAEGKSSYNVKIIDVKSEVIVLKNLIKLIAKRKVQLLLNFITDKQNLYKEHLIKNYNDKIFFFEPINRYIDIIQVKKEMINEITKLNNNNLGIKQKINAGLIYLKSKQEKIMDRFMITDYESYESQLLTPK